MRGSLPARPRKLKALVYVVSARRLLVFRHVDFSYEEVGLQVPGGTVKPGEDIQATALRELQEETGHEGFRILRKLGVAEYDVAPAADHIQERHFFLAEPTAPLPERWFSQEDHDGLRPPTRFECFWIALEHGHVLCAGQGALLSEIA